MKIIMIGPGKKVKGGISAVINGYIDYFTLCNSNSQTKECVLFSYIETMKEGSKLKKFFVFIRSIIRLAFELPECDLVHIHLASNASFHRKNLVSKIVKLYRKPYIIHLHGGGFYEFYSNGSKRLKHAIERCFDEAAIVLVLSSDWKKKIESITRSEIKILHNGVNLPSRLLNSKIDHQILFLGNICKEKGVFDLLYVIKKIEEQNIQYQLYIAGVGEIDALKKLIAELGLKNVNLLGWIEGKQKEEWLSSSSIFVLPSYFEGVPLSMLEAMAYKCAVLVSTTGGITDIIQDNQNGLVHEPGDLEKIFLQLRYLLTDAKNRERLQYEGYSHVKDNFSLESLAVDLKEIYSKIRGD